jgi:hypothetical protein
MRKNAMAAMPCPAHASIAKTMPSQIKPSRVAVTDSRGDGRLMFINFTCQCQSVNLAVSN